MLLLMVLGTLLYGSYFALAHSVQEIANDAARAAVAGLTADERQQLARSSLSTDLATYKLLDPTKATLTYVEHDQIMSVDIVYDATSNPLWGFSGLVPLPSPSIDRAAAVRIGGY